MAVLAATDFSDAANHALRYAAIRAYNGDMPLTVVHCAGELGEGFALKDFVPDSESVLAEKREELEDELETIFRRVVPVAQRPKEVAFRVEFRSAADGINDVIYEGDYQLAVVGPTGRGAFTGLLVGSTAEEIVRSSAVPTLVVPPEWETTHIDTVLAPVDFSACSRESLDYAAELARATEAHLVIFHHFVVPYGAVLSFDRAPESEEVMEVRREHEKKLDELVVETDLNNVDFTAALSSTSVTNQTTDEAIIDAAERVSADLIVMGTHGRRGLERLFLGSTAFKTLRRSSRPVLTVRKG